MGVYINNFNSIGVITMKQNDFYKLNKEDKDKIMFFYFAPNGSGEKYWKKLIDERKKGNNKKC